MNESGRAVAEAMHFYKLGLSDIVVFHDEIELPPAKVRVKAGGGIAGHNGLRSISAHVGNDYRRVRIGVGHPGVKDLVHAHVLSDFAKSERAWVEALCDVIADNAETARAGQGRELPEQGASRDDGEGFRRNQELRGKLDGLQMRHRRPAECRQVDAVQRADRDRGGAGRELSVLHHRAECRRGRGAGPAARRAGEARQVGRDHSDAAHLRRHRRAGEGRLAGRGARQPVPRQYPRGRRDRACGALLRRSAT